LLARRRRFDDPGVVIPAKAGTHFDFDFRAPIERQSKMDSGFRRSDEK
jgi:hypothetical protein